MSTIVDQHGQPIDRTVFIAPQTANVTALENRYLTPMLGGLTPARLDRVLREADAGNLFEQHRLFADLEERDAHLRSEMDKRRNAVASLRWSVVPPRNANAAEKAAAEWVTEMLTDATDPLEDILLSLMEGVGHGFAAVELEWRREGQLRLPTYLPRPQEWFTLDQSRSTINLIDGSSYGAALRPFGWVMHTHGKPKSGYMGRAGLHRTLVWLFLYKAYALGDFAEFLETYGLPIIIGKYFAGASADEKSSLMRAVTALGHDARAIMPDGMSIDIKEVSGSGGSAHLDMINWAEKSQSKSILGQTLTTDVGAGGGGSFALGKVHNGVRLDLARGDARQISGTITRDLIYPMVAINRPGIEGLARCPRFVLETSQPEDMAAYATALPKMVAVGFKIPRSWAQERLHIPEPKGDEEILVLQPRTAQAPAAPAAAVALSATIPAQAGAPTPGPVDGIVAQLASAANPVWASQIGQVGAMVANATSLASLQDDMVAAFGGAPQETMVQLMAAAFALAELKGLSDAQGGA